MVYRDIRHWLLALETAFSSLRGREPRLEVGTRLFLWAEPCSHHAPHCAWVMLGKRVEHIPWAESDPVKCAQAMLGGFRLAAARLPPPPPGAFDSPRRTT